VSTKGEGDRGEAVRRFAPSRVISMTADRSRPRMIRRVAPLPPLPSRADTMGMALTHRRFTVDEYHRMAEVGVFEEDDRVELLDGEIVEMTPIGDRHVACVVRLNDLLSRRSVEPLVSVQNPLVLASRSEPQPDIVVLPRQADHSAAWLPRGADALLVIEVADTSVDHDRDVKIPLYAVAGIPEVWLVDLPAELIEVYQDPEAGRYTTRRIVARGASLSPRRLPQVTLAADEILGPRAR